jgi:hypothetical protein
MSIVHIIRKIKSKQKGLHSKGHGDHHCQDCQRIKEDGEGQGGMRKKRRVSAAAN